MNYFLVIILTALGVGIGSPGIRLLSGILIIPVALFFGNLWFHLPLSTCGRALAFFAFVRLGIQVIPLSRKTKAFKDWKFYLLHPVTLIPLVYFFSYLLFVQKPFTLHEWDEFSNWGLMPKQILLFNKVSDPSFPYTRFLEYTPGWPLLLDYPYFVLGDSFKIDFLIFAVVALSTGLAAAVWDTVYRASGRRLYAWAALLLVARLYIGVCIYPTQILSELPLEALFCSAILLALRWTQGIRDESEDLILWGIVLCAGFLVKKSYLGIILLFLWMSVSYLRNSKTKLRLLRLLGIAWLPFTLAVFTWHITTKDYPHLFKLVPKATGFISAPMIYGMLNLSKDYLLSYWLFSLIGIISFALGLRTKKFRSLFCILLIYNSVYFVSLYWLYLTTFPGEEGLHLASFERYIQSLFKTDLFASILFLFLFFKDASFSNIFRKRKSLHVYAPTVSIIALLLANLEQLQFSFHLMNKYGDPSPILAQAPGLIQLLDERGWRGRNVWMIDEGEGGIVIWQSIFSAIDHAGPLAFNTPFPSDPDERKLSENEIKNLIAGQQVIWPVVVGKKTENTIRKFLSPSIDCSGPLEAYYWVRGDASKPVWTCVKKKHNSISPV